MTFKFKKLKSVTAVIITSGVLMYSNTAFAVSCGDCSKKWQVDEVKDQISTMQSEIAKAIEKFRLKFEELNKSTDTTSLTTPIVPEQSASSGKSKPADINKVITDMTSKGKSIPDTLIELAKAEQQIRLNEQADLSVYLDAAIGTVPCKLAGKCTILKYLQEQVANQVDTLQKDVVTQGAIWIDPNVRGAAASKFHSQIFLKGFLNDPEGQNPQAISSFLSPAPMVPAGFEPDYTKGALTPERAQILGDTLVGLNDLSALIERKRSLNTPGSATIQSKILTRFARTQLARHAIMQVNHKSISDAMNVEFKACVIRPTIEDTVNMPTNQHLVNIEQLLKCNNLSLMHVRRLQMEQSRLLATMLATMLDQWAFSTSDEDSNTVNTSGNQ